MSPRMAASVLHFQSHLAHSASSHLSVDHKLPDRQEAADEAGEHHIQHPDNQHWRPPRDVYFLHQLRKFNLPQEVAGPVLLCNNPVCSLHITVWFGSATKQDRNRLQRTVRTSDKIIGSNLPSIQDIYMSRIRKHLQIHHTLDTATYIDIYMYILYINIQSMHIHSSSVHILGQ